LEDEIRDGIPFLSVLPPDRCAAQVAFWAGRARLHQQDPVNGRTRIATGMLLEKLRGLARAMDLGRIDALASSAEADWGAYVKEQQAIAAGIASLTGTPEKSEATETPDGYGSIWR
jgi:hypothetical protein